MFLTYRYRLLPSKRQHRALEAICEAQRQLYNAALEERIGCYRATGKTRTFFDQCKALTICRRDPELATVLPLWRVAKRKTWLTTASVRLETSGNIYLDPPPISKIAPIMLPLCFRQNLSLASIRVSLMTLLAILTRCPARTSRSFRIPLAQLTRASAYPVPLRYSGRT